MRSAGCIANDLADQSIDKSVKRTKNRQLVLKNITNQTAFIFLLSLLALSFFLVLQLNIYTIYLWHLFIFFLTYLLGGSLYLIPLLFIIVSLFFGNYVEKVLCFFLTVVYNLFENIFAFLAGFTISFELFLKN